MKNMLADGGVYLSDNVDSGKPPPLVDYVFYVVETFYPDRDANHGLDRDPHARILVLEGDDIYPPGSMHVITPAYWIWSGSWRIV